MESTESEWATLAVHVSTPSAVIRGIDAQARIAEPGIGLFRYVLRADIARVRIPAAQPQARADGLWRHTCFEAFIETPGAAGYHELNFAPSGQWAAYRFSAYREGMSSPQLDVSPQISVRHFADRLELDATVGLRQLTGLRAMPRLRVGLCAVVEEKDAGLSYWALEHGPGKADFHWPGGFLLVLEDL